MDFSFLEGLKLLVSVAGSVRPGRRSLPPARSSDEPVPAAPWALSGSGSLQMELVATEAVAPLLPPQLRPVPVVGDRTLSVLFLGRYERSPVGPYHEAMRVAGLCRPTSGGEPAFHVSWIPVDSERSVQGGRAHWAVPKALGRFEWSGPGGSVEDEHGLLRVEGRSVGPAAPLTLSLPFLSIDGEDLIRYTTTFAASVAAARLSSTAPPTHPGRSQGVGAGAVYLREFDLLVSAPSRQRLQ